LLEKKKIVGAAKGTASKKDNATASNVKAKAEIEKTATETTANGTMSKTTSVESSKDSDMPTTSKTTQKMPSKESRLKAFESSFLKIGYLFPCSLLDLSVCVCKGCRYSFFVDILQRQHDYEPGKVYTYGGGGEVVKDRSTALLAPL